MHWDVYFHRALSTAVGLGLVLLSGCQPATVLGGGMAAPVFTLSASERVLAEPLHNDWASQRITSPAINRHRADFVKGLSASAPAKDRSLMAWTSATTNWKPNGYPGVTLSSLGDAVAGDTMPNGPAATFYGGSVIASVTRKTFFLTKNGYLLRVDKDNPATSPSALRLPSGGGKTFSKTAVTLSPCCSMAYCLSDDGTLYIVDTTHTPMTILSTQTVSGGFGIEPVLDPLNSNSQDLWVNLYVPDNGGTVHQYTITGGGPQTSAVTVTNVGNYALATGVTAKSGATTYEPNTTYNPAPNNAGGTAASTNKVASSCIAIGGKIFLNDEAGNFHSFDTSTGTHTVYAIADYGIETAPAIEIQDGSYSLTNSSGTAVTVANDTPIYAFVTVGKYAGPSCAWINLINGSVTTSQPLYMDDHDQGDKADYLTNYNYNSITATSYMAAQDGTSVAQDGGSINPANASGNAWQNSTITPAEVNHYVPGAVGDVTWSSNNATGVSFDATGHVWVTDPTDNKVFEYDGTGNATPLATISTGISNPQGICFDQLNDFIWVANQNNNTVTCIDTTTTPPTQTNYSPGSLNQPTGIAADSLGNVWVTNKGNNTVVQLSSSGTISIAAKATGNSPIACAVDPSDNVWIANNGGGNTVTEYSSSGSLLRSPSVGGGNNPFAISTDSSGNAWVACNGGNSVVELSSTGSSLATFSINSPRGIVVDGSDNVWVTSNQNPGKVYEISGGSLGAAIVVGLTSPNNSQPYGIDAGAGGVAVALAGGGQGNGVDITSGPPGGPTYGYLRFQDPNLSLYPNGTTIQSATLQLTTTTSSKTQGYPPEVWTIGGTDSNGSTGCYYSGTTTLWNGAGGLTAANAPALGTSVGIWGGANPNNKTNQVGFSNSKSYTWDVSAGTGGIYPVLNYAFALKYDTGSSKWADKSYPTYGNTVYYPGGPSSASSKGGKPPFYAPNFQNYNNGETGSASSHSTRPVLAVTVHSNIKVATGAPQTAPMIDSVNHRVFVQNTNYIYQLSFASTTVWQDLGVQSTAFNTLYWGNKGGATMDGKTEFPGNMTSPSLAYDGSAIFCYNFWNSGSPPYSQWKAAITKINLPLIPGNGSHNSGTDQQSPNTGAPGTQVSNTFSSGTSTLSTPNGSKYMVIDFDSSASVGSGLFGGWDFNTMVYQFDPT